MVAGVERFDVAIVGAGVTGVALARALVQAAPAGTPGTRAAGKRRVVLLEKEARVAVHTSGRNSGVAHAGYNPKPGSLKARLCVEGNRRLREFCKSRGVPLVEGGILVVALREDEIAKLDELLARGTENGVPGLRRLDAKELREVEPNAAGLAALHAPSGASLDSTAYVAALAHEAEQGGVALRLGQRVTTIDRIAGGFKLATGDGGALEAATLVNCAGLHADRVAHALGAGLEYGIVPIRGEYRKVRPARVSLVRSMVYPVPHHDFPFLGVHWTKTAHGEVTIGPNAIPALGREAYAWRDSTLSGALALARDARAWRLLLQPGFPTLLWGQLRGSLGAKRFALEAKALVPAAEVEDFLPGPSGIRAQVVDREGRLVEDLVVEEKDGAVHVLNVVSPGLTCSLAFADELARRVP